MVLSVINRAAAIVLLVLLLGLYGPYVSACSCMVSDERKLFRDATAIFQGKLKSVREYTVDAKESCKRYMAEYTFEVEKSWKGAEVKVFRLHGLGIDPKGEEICIACQAAFSKGQSYVIAAYEYEGKLRTSACRSWLTEDKYTSDRYRVSREATFDAYQSPSKSHRNAVEQGIQVQIVHMRSTEKHMDEFWSVQRSVVELDKGASDGLYVGLSLLNLKGEAGASLEVLTVTERSAVAFFYPDDEVSLPKVGQTFTTKKAPSPF